MQACGCANVCSSVCVQVCAKVLCLFYAYVCMLDWRVHVGMWSFLVEDMIVGRFASVTVHVTK